MEPYHPWPKHDPSQPPPASSAPPGIQGPPQPQQQPSYTSMRPGPPVPPPLRTLGIPPRTAYPYATTVQGPLGKSTNPIPPPSRSHLVHPHPRQHGMYHPIQPPPTAPAPHSYYQAPYPPQPPQAQPPYPVDYASYRQPPPLRAPRQQEPSRQPPPPQGMKRLMSTQPHLTTRHLGAAAPISAVHDPASQSSNIQGSSLPAPITSAPSANPRSTSQPVPMDTSGQQPLVISSAPVSNSQRLQPVGHTVSAQRAAHHPVAAIPSADTAREESHIVGSTSAGAQVVMVTSDPQLAQNGGQGGDRGSGFRQLKVEDALMYLEQVKGQFTDQPAVYNQFLDIMKEFKAQSIDTAEVIKRVSQLFHGHKALILGFNTFLPPGYKIELRDDPATGLLTTGYRAPSGAFSTLPGTALPPASAIQNQQQLRMGQQTVQPQGRNPYQSIPAHQGGGQHQNPYSQSRLPAPGQTQPHPMHHPNGAPMGQHGTAMSINPGLAQRANQQLMDAHASAQILAGQQHKQEGAAAALVNRFSGAREVDPAPTEAGKPIEFNQAVNYVNKIKSRFSENESVYKSFLDILQTYQKEQRTIQEVYTQVSELFRDHEDLLNEFGHFLPEAQPLVDTNASAANAAYMGSSAKKMDGVESPPVAGNGRGPNNYAGLHAQGRVPASRGNENVAVGKTGGVINSILPHSSRKNVNATSSDIVRKNRKSSSRKYQDANTAPQVELAFFAEVREQLGENGDKNYKELLKIVNLVSQEVITMDELPKLLEGLLGSHKNVLAAFKMFINQADPNAAERALALLRDDMDAFEAPVEKKAPAKVAEAVKLNDKYRNMPLSDVAAEYGDSIEGTEGYRKFPKDLGGVQCSGMTEADRSVLNFEAASTPYLSLWSDKDDGKQWSSMKPKRKQSKNAVRANARDEMGDGNENESPQSPTAVLERRMPYAFGVELVETVEDQRGEFEVLIGCCTSAVRKLESMMRGESRANNLEGRDWYPIRLIYADAFPQFEALLKNNNEHAIKSVHKRLEGRRKEWLESQKLMEKIWRTHRYASTDNPKHYTRKEMMSEAEMRKEVELKHNIDNRMVIDELIWYMVEWTVDTAEEANEVMDVINRIYKLLDGGDEYSFEFTADVHLYYLMRLLASVSEVSEWLIQRPNALQETMKMVENVLEGSKGIVDFEEYCKETYKNEGWEDVLPDFVVMLKKVQISATKAPKRTNSLMQALKMAEMKKQNNNNNNTNNEEWNSNNNTLIRVEATTTTKKENGDTTTTLKFRKIMDQDEDKKTSRNNNNNEKSEKKKNSNNNIRKRATDLVRYVNRMVEKKKRKRARSQVNEDEENENEKKKAKSINIQENNNIVPRMESTHEENENDGKK